jgi:hypothetical protein
VQGLPDLGGLRAIKQAAAIKLVAVVMDQESHACRAGKVTEKSLAACIPPRFIRSTHLASTGINRHVEVSAKLNTSPLRRQSSRLPFEPTATRSGAAIQVLSDTAFHESTAPHLAGLAIAGVETAQAVGHGPLGPHRDRACRAPA